MLDDLKNIHTRDGSDALGIAQKQWQQYQHDFNFSWQPPNSVSQVVMCGMGGSGLAAKAIDCWPGLDVAHQVVQEYDLPSSVSKNTLLLACSYSGNTEEELSILDQALALPEDKKPMIVVIASGGKLQEVAEQQKLPFILLPTGYQPRMAFAYQLRALAEIFKACSILKASLDELKDASDWLKDKIEAWDPVLPTKNNVAKRLALDLVGKSIVVYSSAKMFPVAYKWKISFNESSKNLAWCNQYSEFNHNEFLGWTSHPIDKPYAVVDLRSKLDHPQIQKRFEVSDRLLSGIRPSPEIVMLEGDSSLRQMIWGIALGDFVSIYLAVLNGIDPTPVDLIEKLKKLLN